MDRWVMSPGRGSHFGRSCLRYSKLSISQVEGWIGVSAEELGYKKVCVTTAGQKSNGCSAQGFPEAKTPESKWQCCLKPGRVGYGTAEDLAECGTETLIKVFEVFIS